MRSAFSMKDSFVLGRSGRRPVAANSGRHEHIDVPAGLLPGVATSTVPQIVHRLDNDLEGVKILDQNGEKALKLLSGQRRLLVGTAKVVHVVGSDAPQNGVRI